MAIQLPPQPGLSNPVVRSVPPQWDPEWFRRFITNYLKFADARNAIGKGGIQISGTLTGPAIISLVAAGNSQPTFGSGDLQYKDPVTGGLAGSDNFVVGLLIPNPSGVPGPALLLGSGFGPGGSGNPGSCWIVTDQAFDANTAGNTLGITAGETQPSGIAAGGLLWLIGGASFGGLGGELRLQAGTSANGGGGPTNIFGGAATGNTSAAIPGDLFLSAGEVGQQGANVHIISTVLSGIPGAIRFRSNSNLLYEIESTGALFIGNTVNSFGLSGQAFVSGGPGASPFWLTAFTGTITTAKLTTGGTNGSMTFASGFLISQVAAT